MSLALERVEQRAQLVRSADGREHEVEGRELRAQGGQAIVTGRTNHVMLELVSQ